MIHQSTIVWPAVPKKDFDCFCPPSIKLTAWPDIHYRYENMNYTEYTPHYSNFEP